MMQPPQGHFFAQDETEFNELLSLMMGSNSVLEIGSRYGESLKRFAGNTHSGSRIVSVDLGYCVDSGERSAPWLYKVMGEIAEERDPYLFIGDSHDPSIVKSVKELGPYDFVFIDGDHSKEGVLLDWMHYGPMGKMVAFHDCGPRSPVNWLFKAIDKENKRLIWNEPGGMGIGVIQQ